ncbi:MAG: hypothetical protein ACUVV0_04725 [Anaerolineae bacterium]
MVETAEILEVREDNSYWLEVSVPAVIAPDVADALAFLMRQDEDKNVSAWVCEAVMAHARSLGWEMDEDDHDARLLAEAMRTATEFITLDELIADYKAHHPEYEEELEGDEL